MTILVALPVVLPVAGFAWLAAAVATGERYPGLSRVWIVPAFGGGLLALIAPVLAATVAWWLQRRRPVAGDIWLEASRDATLAARPLWLAWATVLLLLSSTQANHVFAFWPRLRLASAGTVLALGVLAAGVAILRRIEAETGALSRLVRRTGVPALIFGSAFALYLATAGGHLYTPDEWAMYAAAAGLVNHGIPAAFENEPYPLNHLGRVRTIPESGAAYTKYGILPSLLVAPLYALAKITGPGSDLPDVAFPYDNRALPLVPLVLGPAWTAAVMLLYQVAHDLGYTRRAALLAAAALAGGSLAWPYASTIFNMMPAGALLLASLWGGVRALAARGGRAPVWWWIVSGASLGLATAARYEALLAGALLMGPLILPDLGRRSVSFHSTGSEPPADHEESMAHLSEAVPAASHDESGIPWHRWLDVARQMVQRTVPFVVGLAATTVPLVFGINLLRSGALLNFGYGTEGTLAALATKPWYGIYGILFSPGCGLVSFTPLMALGMLALPWLWRDAPRPAWGCALAITGAVLYYGSAETWCGSTTWGPRYLLLVAPFMALPLAAFATRLGMRVQGSRVRSQGSGEGDRTGPNPLAWLVFGGAAVWSIATNALAVLVDFNRGWQDTWANDRTFSGVLWWPYFTGIVTHFRVFREWLLDGRGGLDVYLLYAPGAAGPLVVALLISVAVGAAAVAWLSASDG